MINGWILTLTILLIIIPCLYFITRHKKLAVQVSTLESFLNAHHSNGSADTNKSKLDSIKGFLMKPIMLGTAMKVIQETSMMEATMGENECQQFTRK
ncbi:hypothetical protein [Cytobacillus firmus]|uniref:hypothetical protein n=1 Tax=Cytobacillus firmus TaxID=1399 RepID=UPI001F555503|nr:hypothetical protein [Cytobacillus firmus]